MSQIRCLSILGMAIVMFPGTTSLVLATDAATLGEIGLTSLQSRLGASAPTGAGIDVKLIEAGSTAWVPDDAHPELLGDTILDITGSGGISVHATTVGRNFFGSNGVSPDVDDIHSQSANSWINSGGLRTLQSSAPAIETRRVQNNSWIANFVDIFDNGMPPNLLFTAEEVATDALRRNDFMINRDDILSIVGVNNGSGSSFPQLLANSYNAIAVGLTSGNSTQGPTTIDLPGRSKPDLVAPKGVTSYATPLVAGSAALLLETAGKPHLSSNPRASRWQTIKAVLMAGATKSEFDLTGSTGTTLDDWSRTTTQPLDRRYGAGELNIDNSERILSAGEQEASAVADVGLVGWDFDTIEIGETQSYFFDIAAGFTADLSILTTWAREIDFTAGVSGNPATLTPSLANVDLQLFEATGFTPGTMVDESVSTLDNVEHIFQQDLAAGRYVFQLQSDMAWDDVAIAWDIQLTAVPEPSTLLLASVGFAGFWSRRRRKSRKNETAVRPAGRR